VSEFGGDWTDEKLQPVKEYLSAYVQVLKNQPFEKIAYIDAFAGTGYRIIESPSKKPGLFTKEEEQQYKKYVKGSAQVALEVEPPFDRYVFIELDADACKKLEDLKSAYPDKADKIKIVNDDANVWLREKCNVEKEELRVFWRENRAVVFLDPFGMQVEWETIEAIARTRAIDLWVLFPLGVAVNRMLTKTGEIPVGWRKRLNRIFGTDQWYGEFYRETKDLFGEEVNEKIVSLQQIGKYYNERLKTVFPGVANNPKPLLNSTNVPIYLLCFAVGNPNAVGPALKIAQHILNQ
jgi:three-Cys-motif partner protein